MQKWKLIIAFIIASKISYFEININKKVKGMHSKKHESLMK